MPPPVLPQAGHLGAERQRPHGQPRIPDRNDRDLRRSGTGETGAASQFRTDCGRGARAAYPEQHRFDRHIAQGGGADRRAAVHRGSAPHVPRAELGRVAAHHRPLSRGENLFRHEPPAFGGPAALRRGVRRPDCDRPCLGLRHGR